MSWKRKGGGKKKDGPSTSEGMFIKDGKKSHFFSYLKVRKMVTNFVIKW